MLTKVLMLVVLMAVFFVVGWYCGGALFIALSQGSMATLTWHTLIYAWSLPLTDPRFAYVPWATCATAGITFLPGIVVLVVFFGGRFRRRALHGSARFANNAELKPYLYRGNYSKS